MKINHISVSRKGVYGECEQRYKYQYHLGMSREGPEEFYFTYGKMVHKVAELYVNNNGKLLLEEISRDILKGKTAIDEDKEGNEVFMPRLPLEYKRRLPAELKALEHFLKQTGTTGHTEYFFKYDLDPPNKRYAVGFIDRIIVSKGQYFIVDYKTTKKGPWRKTSRTIVEDLQLRTYAKVVQNNFGVSAENIRAALLYVQGGDLIGAKFSQESLDQAQKELLKAHREIESKDPDDTWGNVGRHCRRCDFRTICPFYKIV